MPKRQQYEADDGFVEDVPQGKKRKSVGNEMKQQAGKATVSTEMQNDDDGNEYWEISGKGKRVQISSFKGNLMVGIREFYEKDGKSLPGKKGIALTTDQFAAILEVLPQIESVLQSKGVTLPRPKYDDPVAVSEAAADQEPEEAESEEDEVPHVETKPSNKLETFKFKKANHEATDDEDD